MLGIRPELIGPTHAIGFIAGLQAGLANRLEKSSRRIELALYVATHALRSQISCCRLYGWDRHFNGYDRSPHASTFFYVLSCACLGHFYLRYPKKMRPQYLNSLTYFLDRDSEAIDRGTPRGRRTQELQNEEGVGGGPAGGPAGGSAGVPARACTPAGEQKKKQGAGNRQ
jgi:hypothetical protein